MRQPLKRTPLKPPAPIAGLARRVAIILAIAHILGLLSGCRNIYSDAHDRSSPDPCQHLNLRIHEARLAEQRAEAAAAQCNGASGASLDKFETATLDFHRVLRAATEAAAQCNAAQRFVESLDEMENRSRSLLDQAVSLRATAIAK